MSEEVASFLLRLPARRTLTLFAEPITVDVMSPLPTSLNDPAIGGDEDLGDYRAVSASAVIGLILGILSATALIHPLLWVLAWVATAVNGIALRRIADANSRLVGRKVALIGLGLSLIFSVAAPVQFAVHRRQLRREAVDLAREWFGYLRDNRPEMAFRVAQMPATKTAREQSPLANYESGSAPIKQLQDFLHDSAVDLLLKLGKRAHIRLYENEEVWSGTGGMEGVRDVYAVTVNDGGQPTSFFIRFGATRTRDLATGEWEWQVTKYEFLNAPPQSLADAVGG